MSLKNSKLFVVDIECTCYPHNAFPKGEKQEIIEIGVAVLNTQYLDIEEVESILVVPTSSSISAFCTQLTTLTPSMFSSDRKHEHTLWSFKDACAYLETKYLTRACAWGSWGDFDRVVFEQQCAALGVGYPFGKTHLNIKTLFSLFLGRSKGYGMMKALRIAGITHEGVHHRGSDDARNIARIASWIFRHRGNPRGGLHG